MINPTTFRPLGNRVLAKRLSAPEQTASGLFLLGREYPTMGEVISCGPGRRNKNGTRSGIADILGNSLRAGDLIYFHKEVVRRDLVFSYELGNDYVIIDGEFCLLRVREL